MARIGSYSDRVTIESRTLTNVGGQPVEAWTATVYRAAASVLTATGAVERVFGVQLQGETTHTVTLAAPTSAVSVTDRVVWHSRHGDRTLAIVGVSTTQDALRREAILACKESRTP